MSRNPKILMIIFVLFSLCGIKAYASGCNEKLTIVSPSNNASYTYSGSGVNININVTYSDDPNCGTSPRELQYFVNGATQCDNFNAAPNQYSCPVSGLGIGSYSLVVKNYDGSGGATSNTVNISVVAPPTTVSLSLNTTSINLPSSIVMTANPSANGYGYISKVQFYADGNLLYTSYGPYTYTWNNPPQGNHSITAKAYNGQSGATATTSGINVSAYSPPGFIAYDNQCPSKL